MSLQGRCRRAIDGRRTRARLLRSHVDLEVKTFASIDVDRLKHSPPRLTFANDAGLHAQSVANKEQITRWSLLHIQHMLCCCGHECRYTELLSSLAAFGVVSSSVLLSIDRSRRSPKSQLLDSRFRNQWIGGHSQTSCPRQQLT